MAPNR